MSRPIAESLSLLSETLGNCKTNLKEKSVADVDNIKISDVDEKIAEIEISGGSSSGGGFNWIRDVTFNGSQLTKSHYENLFDPDGRSFGISLQFTTNEDVYFYFCKDGDYNDVQLESSEIGYFGAAEREIKKDTTVTITGTLGGSEYHTAMIISKRDNLDLISPDILLLRMI